MKYDILGKMKSIDTLFLLTVAVPTVISVFYFLLLASDVYISESRFVVRSPDKPAATGLGMLLKSTGFSSGSDEVFAAQDYVVSRDGLHAINEGGKFASAYRSDNIFFMDRFGTFWTGTTTEDLYKYYKKKVGVDYQSGTGITTLTVRAYSAEDARRFNEQLLEAAERTVNQLNERGRSDLIRFASSEVSDAKIKATEAALALSSYRNREGVVDPDRQATAQLQLISKLQDELIATKTQLVQLRSFTPRNPQIEVLDAKVAGLTREISGELDKIAGDRKSLSTSAVQYQRLTLESQFADRQLAAAMASLEEALNEARRKQAYVERIVQPNLPDDALEPRRWRGIIATFVLGIVAWGILSMLLAGIREHRD